MIWRTAVLLAFGLFNRIAVRREVERREAERRAEILDNVLVATPVVSPLLCGLRRLDRSADPRAGYISEHTIDWHWGNQ